MKKTGPETSMTKKGSENGTKNQKFISCFRNSQLALIMKICLKCFEVRLKNGTRDQKMFLSFSGSLIGYDCENNFRAFLGAPQRP